jgi:quercetin dioxygenase-like cupin family protein
MEATEKGALRVVGPDEAPSYWQPVPANGFVRCVLSGKELGLGFSMGTQTVAPGCMVREHSHDRHDEVIHITAGRGTARLEGEEVPIETGSTLLLGRNRKHAFINPGPEPMTFVWFLAPGGLEDFFAAIGRPRTPGEPAPAPFPRPADVAEIEKRTVFGWADQTPRAT